MTAPLGARVLSALTPQRSEEVGELAGLRLCRSDYSHQGGESLLMDAPALRQREGLGVVRLEAEKRADLSKDATEARSCLERFEPTCIGWRRGRNRIAW